MCIISIYICILVSNPTYYIIRFQLSPDEAPAPAPAPAPNEAPDEEEPGHRKPPITSVMVWRVVGLNSTAAAPRVQPPALYSGCSVACEKPTTTTPDVAAVTTAIHTSRAHLSPPAERMDHPEGPCHGTRPVRRPTPTNKSQRSEFTHIPTPQKSAKWTLG